MTLLFDFSHEPGLDDGTATDHTRRHFVVGDLGVVIFVRVHISVTDECELALCRHVGATMNVRPIREARVTLLTSAPV